MISLKSWHFFYPVRSKITIHTGLMYALSLGFDWPLSYPLWLVCNSVENCSKLNFLLTTFHSWTDLICFCVSVFKKGSIQTCCLLQRNSITHVWGKTYGLITKYVDYILYAQTPMCICHPGLYCKPEIVLWDLCENRLIKKSACLYNYFFCYVCTMYIHVLPVHSKHKQS